MRFDLFGDWNNPYLSLPVESKALVGYLLLALYLAILLFAFYRHRREIGQLSAAKVIVWLILILASAIFSNTVEFHLFGAWFPPAQGASLEPVGHDLPLLAHIPILLAAGLGLIPAVLVGLAGGLVRALFETHRTFHMFEVALFGLVASYLIRQEYRGRFFAILRQPLIASLLAALAAWLASIPSLWVFTPGDPLPTFIRVWAFLVADLPVILAQAVLAGMLLQIVFWIRPALKPVQVARRTPPYGRSLNMRMVAFMLPMILIFIVSLFYAVNVTAISIATRQTIIQAARDASNVSERIPFFFQTGQSLISDLAADRDLRSDDAAVRRARLERALRTVAFFDQLALLDGEENLIAIYPSPPLSEPTLSDRERELIKRAARAGATQISSVHQSIRGNFVISFIAPVYDAAGELYGYLVGRADMDRNPMMRGIVSNLQWTLGAGVGFIVDERGRIVAHPDQSALFSTWDTNSTRRRTFDTPQGEAYEDYDLADQRQLVYYLPVQGYPWATVVTVPHEVILAQAAQISTPLVILLALMGVIASAILPLITARLTQPVQELARAASSIAHGELDSQVEVSGEDEVGRLGIAFEQMRIRLKERLEELSLLLAISQAVSASLDLERGLMPILEGAVQATDALSARILLVNASGRLEKTIFSGPLPDRALDSLDAASRQVIDSGQPVLVEDVSQMPEMVAPALLAAGLAAAVGLPLRTKGRVRGVLWVDYAAPRRFNRTEMDFLSTLAGQAAVVAENARLFETVESERGRLAAILASTTDAILVVDREQRLLLANPAAESTFDIRYEHTEERPLPEIIANEQLIEFMAQSVITGKAMIGEIPLLDERTLYVNASPVVDSDGQTLGCVAVLRDITHLKQLDAMKSDFVATVSHDLRAPLTFVRGYTTMIPMVGEVNDKQRDFIEKITTGIEQMTELIDDLLDIGKIEAGVGVEMAPCRLDEIIRGVVDSLQERAQAGQLTLEAKLPAHLPPIIGDQTLLRQAITNLIDNAIKYTTPPPGSVTVRAEERNGYVVISVHDTGIGIAPAEQLRLFEKFYRVKRRETIKIKGTGLGLAIVKSIADQHCGKVWVDSRPGQGSTFYLALPQKQPPKAKTQGRTA